MGLGKDLPLWLQLLLQFINFAILVGRPGLFSEEAA